MKSSIEVLTFEIIEIIEDINLILSGCSKEQFIEDLNWVAVSIRQKIKVMLYVLISFSLYYPKMFKIFPKWKNYFIFSKGVGNSNMGSETELKQKKLNRPLYLAAWKLVNDSFPQFLEDIKEYRN